MELLAGANEQRGIGDFRRFSEVIGKDNTALAVNAQLAGAPQNCCGKILLFRRVDAEGVDAFGERFKLCAVNRFQRHFPFRGGVDVNDPFFTFREFGAEV